MTTTLHIGPWFGEFGWELMWHAFARREAKKYNRAVVGCFAGSEALYADFADEFVTFGYTSQTQGARLRHCKPSQDLIDVIESFRRRTHLPPRLVDPRISSVEWIPFGRPRDPAPADVVIHARAIPAKGGDRNWPEERWDTLADLLVEKGVKVSAIGRGTASYCPESAHDYRNEKLDYVMTMLANAKLIIGPSSGPIHLAAQCGTPTLCWTDFQHHGGGMTNYQRLKSVWNPFEVPVTLIDGWQPSVQQVFGEAEAILAGDRPTDGHGG